MPQPTTRELMLKAWSLGIVIPSFNVPRIPIMESIVRALRDTNSFGLVAVARLEVTKFEAKSLSAIREEYERVKDERFTRLHLDHTPVIDEDNLRVDYEAFISEAVELGYESVMVDGSRLSLEENIEAAQKVIAIARAKDVPVEAELGAVFGHEAGEPPPYEELFASGKGFTDSDEAQRFVEETGVDWLSVAIGNVHGAVSAVRRDQKKVEARLQIEHLKKLREVTNIPLVLHGGSGIRKEYVLESFKHGIAKINVGTAVRQPYDALREESVEKAQQAVYDAMIDIIRNGLETAGTAAALGTNG